MQHPEEGTIHAWLDGALSADEATKVEAHVVECAQCAAAVAEARGFIAGASRILTALDNIPSGVIPVANAQNGRNWPVWRAAAAIVVVALGSFVVLRDRIGGTKAGVADSVVTTAAAAHVQNGPSSPPEQVHPQIEPQGAPRAAVKAAVPTREVAPSSTNVRVGKGDERAPFVVGAASSVDAASGVSLPKSVATRDEIGRTSTLYEISPGDTVVLTEVAEIPLGRIAVRGARSMGQAAAAKSVAQPQPSAMATTAQSGASLAPPALPPARASNTMSDIANPYNTITWTDSATGKKMTLSGHHSTAELEQIRQTIERARAAHATEKKKEP